MRAAVARAGAAAGPLEVWAARAWNVFNEGRPFSIVYPLLVLLAAAPLGLAPAGPLGLALLGAGARGRGAVALPVRAARPRAALARRAGRAAAARALARARAARRRARRLRVLHGRRLGVGLLPPAHRRALDERAALLAPGAHELGSHERQRARAAAEAPDRAERGHAAGRGAGRGLARCGSPPRWRSPPRSAPLAARSFARRLPRYPERVARERRRAGRSPGAST